MIIILGATRNTILSAIVGAVLLLPLIPSIPSSTTQATMIQDNMYAEASSNNNKNSYHITAISLDPDLNVTNNNNVTRMPNQENKTADLEPVSNNTMVSKNHLKNGTSFSSNATSLANITSTSNLAALGSAGVTADFNGDGYSDLAVGVRNEAVGNITQAGAVNVIYGSSDGLSAVRLAPGNGRADQIWTQDSPSIEDSAEEADFFGSALATGDFNKDGFYDLAIGAPWESVGTLWKAGAVNVIYGSTGGLSATVKPDQLWTQDSIDIVGDAAKDDLFGGHLTTGDFNKDGYSDLAIGVRGEDVGTIMSAGAVNVIYGASSGLSANALAPGNGRFNQIWTQDSPNIWGDPELLEGFGWALATGDFNKDGYSDVVIGNPSETVGGLWHAGAVNVIYGSSDGLSATGVAAGNGRFNQLWSQDSTDVEDAAEMQDGFGFAVAAGDFNKDGISDLAIGVPSESLGTLKWAGAVNVIYGSFGGFSVPHGGLRATVPLGGIGHIDQIWTQNSTDILDDSEKDDNFGWALGTGDFNNDRYSDLAIGTVYETLGSVERTGAVNVIYGSSDGVSAVRLALGDGRYNQLWTQDSPNVEDVAETNDYFGSPLSIGDFNKDGISDLAIAVHGESIGTVIQAGAVNAIYGSKGVSIGSGGLSATVPVGGIGRADQIWTQDSPNIQDKSEAWDTFGFSLG
jgi:FG-GAP repeat